MSENSVIYSVSEKKALEEEVKECMSSLEKAPKLIIKGIGFDINRAVDLYNALSEKMGGALSINSIKIGSELVNNRRLSFMEITISKRG